MAFYIRLVERDMVPAGRDWYLIEEPRGGDVSFVIARDAKDLLMPPQLCDAVADSVFTHYQVYGDRDYDALLPAG